MSSRRGPRPAVPALIAACLTLTAGAAGPSIALPAKASPVVGPDFSIGGAGATGYDTAPAMAFNGNADEYLIVWSDGRTVGGGAPHIYGRRVAADGTRLGSDFRIGGAGAVGEVNPAVAYNGGTGEYLVVWRDARNYWTGRGFDIYGRRVSAAGIPTGPDFRICSLGATTDEQLPAVAYSGAGDEYLVVWSDYRGGASRGYDVYGQRLSPTGVKAGGNFRISGPTATAMDWAAALSWSGAEYLVVWSDYRGGGPRGTDIYGQRVSAAGAAVGGNFRISGPTATGNDNTPALAWNGTEFLVVWQDNRDGATRGADVYGRRVTAAGAPAGASFRISPAAALGDERDPAVAWDGSDYLAVWEDGRDADERAFDTYGRAVSAAGPSGAAFRISGPGGIADEFGAGVAWNGSDFLVVWEDWRDETTRGSDIRGRRVAG